MVRPMKSINLKRTKYVLIIIFLSLGGMQAQSIFPEIVGHFGGLSSKCAINKGYCYFNRGTTIEIKEISGDKLINASNIYYPSLDKFGSFLVDKDRLYLTYSFDTLLIYNISNPKQPVLECDFEIPGIKDNFNRFDMLRINGNTAFLGSRNNGIYLIDIAAPNQPIVKSIITGSVKSFDVDSNFLFILTIDSEPYLKIFDISDQNVPVQIYYNPISPANTIQSFKNHIFIARDNGVDIYDASNVKSPSLLNTIDIVGHCVSTLIEDDILYLNTYNQQGTNSIILNYDISDLISKPVKIWDSGPLPIVSSFDVSGNYLILSLNTNIYIYNIENTGKPVRIINYFEPVQTNNIVIDNKLMYLNNGNILLKYDLKNPVEPKLLNSYTFPNELSKFCVNGNSFYYLSIINDNGKVHLVDLSDTSNPQELGSYEPPEGYIGNFVRIKDKLMFHSSYQGETGNGNIDIIDISEPNSPKRLTSLEMRGITIDYKFDDKSNTVYLLQTRELLDSGWVYAINFNNPKSPEFIKVFFPFHPSTLEIVNNNILIGGFRYKENNISYYEKVVSDSFKLLKKDIISVTPWDFYYNDSIFFVSFLNQGISVLSYDSVNKIVTEKSKIQIPKCSRIIPYKDGIDLYLYVISGSSDYMTGKSVSGENGVYILKIVDSTKTSVNEPDFKNYINAQSLLIYPNPSQSVIKIKYRVYETGPGMLKIFNQQGELIKILEDKIFTPGVYYMEWREPNLNSGMYYFQYQSGKHIETGKIIFVR
jgi:hypothetical protein